MSDKKQEDFKKFHDTAVETKKAHKRFYGAQEDILREMDLQDWIIDWLKDRGMHHKQKHQPPYWAGKEKTPRQDAAIVVLKSKA